MTSFVRGLASYLFSSIAAVLLIFGTATAQNVSVQGVPVDAFGSTTQVGLVAQDGWITYYIPVSLAASGVYAVDQNGTVGTQPDSGSPSGYLTMYMAFGPLTGPV